MPRYLMFSQSIGAEQLLLPTYDYRLQQMVIQYQGRPASAYFSCALTAYSSVQRASAELRPSR